MKLVFFSIFAIVIIQVLARPAPGCLQNYTIVSTDTCVSVAARFGLTDIDFYGMNPGLHHNPAHDCDNLDVGRPFCVCMRAPCAMAAAHNPIASALQPPSAYISNSLLPSVTSGVGYRSVLLSPSASISLRPPIASGSTNPALPSLHVPNMNNMISPSLNAPSNTLHVSGTATGINAQASHFGALSKGSSLSLKTFFATMTACLILSTILLL